MWNGGFKCKFFIQSKEKEKIKAQMGWPPTLVCGWLYRWPHHFHLFSVANFCPNTKEDYLTSNKNVWFIKTHRWLWRTQWLCMLYSAFCPPFWFCFVFNDSLSLNCTLCFNLEKRATVSIRYQSQAHSQKKSTFSTNQFLLLIHSNVDSEQLSRVPYVRKCITFGTLIAELWKDQGMTMFG